MREYRDALREPFDFSIYSGVFFGEGWRVAFDFSHGLAIVDFLTAARAFVILKPGDRVLLPLELPLPVLFDLFDLSATAGWTSRDFFHRVDSP